MKNERIQALVSSAAGEHQPVISPAAPEWQKDLPLSNGSIVTRGMIFVFGFLLLFIVWAVGFPLSSAVVAPGKIISSGQNKLIQHGSGGIVRQILVRDGDVVAKDDVLMILDRANSKAEYSRLVARHAMLSELKKRLEAESQNAGGALQAVSGLTLRGTQSMVAGALSTDSGITDTSRRIAQEQFKEYAAGRNRLNAELDAARAQAESLREQASGLNTRLAGSRQLLQLTNADIARVSPLVKDGYLAKSRLWDLKKVQLEQQTEAGRLQTDLASVQQQVMEAEARIAQLSESDQEKRSEELTRVISDLAEIKDQIIAARSTVEQTELRAPVSGTIVGLTVHTEGGIAEPGKVLAEIVPKSAEMISEFRVGLENVKNVVVGQKARIVVTAFNRRTYDPIEGEITYVSADSTVDPQTGQAYFLARAKMIPDQENQKALNEVQVGMATEVFILSEPRVFMSYAMQPILDSFGKAFNEPH